MAGPDRQATARSASVHRLPVSPSSKPESAKTAARDLAESSPPKLRTVYAQSFCAAAITRYWNKLHEPHGRELRGTPKTKALSDEAAGIAAALGDAAALMHVEEAAYFIGSTYAAMLPPEVRSEHGVYYTPPAVVRRLLDAATEAGVDWSTCRVLDPACGGGAFLGPVAARMMLALKDCERRVIARNIASRLRGYEIDPFAAWMSQVFLDSTLFCTLGGRAGCFDAIDVGDALERESPAAFDLVIGNPPYGRLKLSTEQRAKYSRSLYGHANLYGVFLDLACRHAKPDGVIAYVTPTSFLSGEYFKRLRALLAEQANPVSLDFVDERAGVFDNVLQETLLAVFRKGARARAPQIHFVEAGAGSVAVKSAGSAALSTDPEAPWILPRSSGAEAITAHMRTMTHRLADWGYKVSTGPLVWNRFKPQLKLRPSASTVPLIWAEAVSADGTFGFRAARRNHAPYFTVTDADAWLLVKRPCVLLQRTTSKEQARRLIAAELPPSFLKEHGAVTVENHLNMLVPLGDSQHVDTETLAAFLNSGAADRAFRCISGSVAVSSYELEAMPVPTASAMQALTKLLKGKHTRADIERLCDRLYGNA